MWYSGISCCCVIIMGSILSLVPGFKQEEEDKPEPELLVPVAESLFCCWPASVSSALVQLWEQPLNMEQGSDGRDLALKERTNQGGTDGIDDISESKKPATCILN